jgi:DNA-binding IclR family transcriptional regulator
MSSPTNGESSTQSSAQNGVQSIQRAFAVLRALGDGPLGVSEVAKASRIPKSTAARLLSALQAEGAVEQVPGERRYRLGPDLLAIAHGLSETWDIVAIARPVLVDLTTELGEAAGVSIRDGWTVQYVDQVEPPNPNPVQVRDWTGTRIPLHAVSSGQVFLAQLAAPVLATWPNRWSNSPRERSRTRRSCWSAFGRSATTAMRGSRTSTRSGSRPLRRQSRTRELRLWRRSTSTGRRTASRNKATKTGSRRP